MPKTQSLLTPRPYAMYAFWGLHTLMLAFFLSLEAAGFRMPVRSSIFYFTWIAIWLMHGLTLILGRVRQRERMEGDADSATVRYRRRMVLAAHSALYVAFGPAVFVWWLTVRIPGPPQPGEGQGFWIYPVWLMILLAHSGYVMLRERQSSATGQAEKRKHDVPTLEHLMQAEDVDDEAIIDEEQPRRKHL